MEYAKDKFFKVRYNEAEDSIEIQSDGGVALFRFLKKYKFLSIIIFTTIIAIGVNCILIQKFINILNTLQ